MATLNNVQTPSGRPTLTGLRPHWWIAWWYWLVAPVPPQKEQLTVAERDFLRRGKLISIGFLISTIQILLAFESARETPQVPILFPTLLASLGILAIGALMNRFSTVRRKSLSLIASSILMILTELSMIGQLLPGPLGLHEWALMTLLVVPLMFSVLLFPSWFVFVVAAFNSLAVIILLIFIPKDAQLLFFFQHQPYIIWALPLTLQLTPALVSFIVLASLREHIARADYVEELSRLQQDLAAQKAKELEHAQMLERTVQEIGMTLTNVANKQWNARVQLGPTNALPSVSGQINNFISRYIQLYKRAEPLQRSQYVLNNLLLMLRQARQRNVPMSTILTQFPHTGTLSDDVVRELLFLQTRDLNQQKNVNTNYDGISSQRSQTGSPASWAEWRRNTTDSQSAQPLERLQENKWNQERMG